MKTACPACEAARTNPLTGLSIKTCPDCQAREAAKGPFAFHARVTGRANKGLESCLSPTWADVAAGIKRVNHWMDEIKKHKESMQCQKLF